MKKKTKEEKFIESYNLVDVIGEFVDICESVCTPGEFSGFCPFHEEKITINVKSFKFYPKKGTYLCNRCGASGNALDFIMNHEHLSEKDSLNLLSDMALAAFTKKFKKKTL